MQTARAWSMAPTRMPVACLLLACLASCATSTGYSLHEDVDEGSLAILYEGEELLRYQFAARWAIPHLYPVRSPSGKSMTVQRTEPYPHHRSLWIADRISLQPGGKPVDFYHEWKNQVDKERRELGHKSSIKHVRFIERRADAHRATVVAELTWFVGPEQPALREVRRCVVRALGEGEFLLDLTWTLHAEHGDVRFQSDAVHYAWPYVRMDPSFSGDQGGVIEDDLGRRGQKATNGQYAQWIDYSSTVDGITEGLAVFLPADSHKCKWLTREYGCFGPRRPDRLSGHPFTLEKGQTLESRVGILVHSGDVRSGSVARRYKEWSSPRPPIE